MSDKDELRQMLEQVDTLHAQQGELLKQIDVAVGEDVVSDLERQLIEATGKHVRCISGIATWYWMRAHFGEQVSA